MRASSLSNPQIIDLLNRYFIPVHVDGVYYENKGTVPEAEKAAYEGVFRAFYRLNETRQAAGQRPLSVGTVHAYVLTPDGQPLDSLHVGEARPERVRSMLERAVQTLKVPAGKPVVKLAPQSPAPRPTDGSLVLHLTARYLVPHGQAEGRKDVADEEVPLAPTLGTARSGQWNALPSEDWIELKPADWHKLLPAGPVHVGSSWELDRAVTAQLLTRFYPTTENNDLTTNRFEEQSIRATIRSIQGGVVRARLDGRLKMRHCFYPNRQDDNRVAATLVGYLDFRPDEPRIETLRLVTDRATYGNPSSRFGVALYSLPIRGE
jgi:hypothetical protein